MNTGIVEKALRILEEPVCDNCLGRQFGQLLSGYTNKQRGALLRAIAAMSIDIADYKGGIDFSNFSETRFHNLEHKAEKRKTCSLCGNLFDNIGKLVPKFEKAAKDNDFSTFVVGTKLSTEMLVKEENLWERVGIDYCEPIKAEINRELGKLVEKALRKRADTKKPDVCFVIDLEKLTVKMESMPLFIYGKYQKLVRGIPQTKWPSGKYKNSVEQIIAKPFMRASHGTGHKLHGQGREDIDARCLAWRPFVFEILKPKKRNINIKALAKKIGKGVAVKDMRLSDIAEVRKIKESRSDKSYSVTVKCDKKITRQNLNILSSLAGTIQQRTPVRVLHRRSDMNRKKKVLEIRTKLINSQTFRLIVRCNAGLYVKELVTGDEGRTQPSVSALLGMQCMPKDLDVIKIHEK